MTLRLGGARLALVAALAAVACSGSRTEGLDPSKVPAPLGADYDLFARKCSKCHSLARPLEAGITDDAQWTLYVARMRRQPGSGISHDEADRILRFLYWYAGELRAKKAAEKQGELPPSATVPVPSASVAVPPAGGAPAPFAPDAGPGADGGAP